MYKTILIVGLLSITSLLGASSAPKKVTDGEIHSVKPRAGDALPSLLNRYNFTDKNGLKKQFLKLNNLNPNSLLYLHKNYQLPIYLYNYNGKSIRSTIGVDDWEKAVRIKKYNELLLKKGARLTHFADSKILWVPFSEAPSQDVLTTVDEIAANTPDVPKPKVETTSVNKYKKRVFSDKIYGSKYKDVEIIDNSLKGKVFYIVSGHGGPDPGAVCDECSSRLCEDEYAYDVSLRLDRKLRQHGAKVELVITDKNDGIRDNQILRCDNDERLADNSKIPRGHLSRLQQRTNYVNKKYKEYKKQGYTDQVVLSLHIDSNSESTKQDVFFCYARGSNVSKKLARQIRDKFQEKYNHHQKNRGYKGYLQPRGLYVLRNTAPPAVLIELANIKNKHNQKRFMLSENRQALAKWIYEGLADPYTSVDKRALASSN